MKQEDRELFAFLVGQRVRRSRETKGVSQEDLARGIIGQSALSLLETGRQFPQSDTLLMLADRLDDNLLKDYALTLVDPNFMDIHEMLKTDQNLLRDALYEHRGKWKDIHFKIGLQLCNFYLSNNDVGNLSKVSELVMNHTSMEQVPFRATACYFRGLTCALLGELSKSEALLREAEASKENLSQAYQGRLYYSLGYTYALLEQFGLSMWYTIMARDKFQEYFDYVGLAKTFCLLGTIQNNTGRIHDALQSFNLAHALMLRWNPQSKELTRVQIGLADVYEGLENMSAMKHWAEEAVQSGIRSQDWSVVSAAYRLLCKYALSIEDIRGATLAIQDSLHYARESQDPWSMSWSYLLACGLSDDPEEKLQYAQRAYGAYPTKTCNPAKAVAAEVLSTVHEELGNVEDAHLYQREAMVSYRTFLTEKLTLQSTLRYLPLHAT